MTLRMAFRSFAAQPVRSAVLACGFGLGIASMAGLLGVGEVILEQSRSPALRGGGDLVLYGFAGSVPNARFLTSQVFATPPLAGRVRAHSPSQDGTVYLVEPGREPLAVRARGGIPSLERALADPETSGVVAWIDSQRDRAWSAPDPGDVLRAMDRFHPIPDVPEWAGSWAEWLYFNGTAGDARFYLTFLAGPRVGSNRRQAGVRLQLERAGRLETYSDSDVIAGNALLADAPDLAIGSSRVRLDGMRYTIDLELFEQGSDRKGPPDLSGTITLDAVAGRSVPPVQIAGARGWVSGYVAPVLWGALGGTIRTKDGSVSFDGGNGYHDHNWGFWEGVTWQWGQVVADGLSLLYGRIRPPDDIADPTRIPGLLIALGPDGPLAYSNHVRIEETDGHDGRPAGIVVRAGSASLSLTMKIDVEDTVTTRLGSSPLAGGLDAEFLQMRVLYRVEGTVSGEKVDFERPGFAETFRFAGTPAPADR